MAVGTTAHRGGPLVGYDAAALADQIKKYVGIAERNLTTLESLGQPLADRIKADTATLDAEAQSIIYDRLVKAGLNLVKATDELARLQSFLSGGPDTRPDLSSLGEAELTGLVVTAIRALGVARVQQLLTAPGGGIA